MQKVSHIRKELGWVASALRDELEGEGRELGDDPAIVLYDPEADSDVNDESSPKVAVSGHQEGLPEEDKDQKATPGFSEPAPIFELPPEMEEAEAARILSEEAGEAISKNVLLYGMDALGWYLTFHQTKRQWGIYIPVSGIAYMAARFFGDLQCDNARKFELGFQAIFRHELFHFAADYMAAQWELAVGGACYWPSRSLKDPEKGYNLSEEMLANAYMLRGFRHPNEITRQKSAYARLKAFTLSQPEGYSWAYESVSKEEFEESCGDLLWSFQEKIDRKFGSPTTGCGFDHLAFFPGLPRIDWRYCSIHVVHDEQRYSLSEVPVRFIDRISTIDESPRFRKQLKSLGRDYEGKWQRTKEKLAQSTTFPGLDFKRWQKGGLGVFSIRVDRDVRAHLREPGDRKTWVSESIGRHAEMGHG